MAHRKVVILGAGLAGIELGRHLNKLSSDFAILEKESHPGGLCRTMRTESYHWDLGLHAMYSRHSKVEAYYHSLPVDCTHNKRNVRIFHLSKYGKKRYILDYPFELGIKDMPTPEKMGCIFSAVLARLMYRNNHGKSLKEWINFHYGPIMARYFMLPYNRKIWNCPLSQLSTSLVDSRIEPSPVSGLLKALMGGNVVGRPHQSRYLYPRHGIQQLIDHSMKEIKDKVILNARVRSIQRHNDKWFIKTTSGDIFACTYIISTIPLAELLKMISIYSIRSSYKALKWNNTYFVMVALKGASSLKLLKNTHWAFFKKHEIFYRISMMHNLMGGTDPVIVAEITQKDGVSYGSRDDIIKNVIDDLIRRHIIGSVSEIACTDLRLIEYTYPIPTIDLVNVRDHIRNTLAPYGIYLFGRSGNWEYLNMDDIILSAEEYITKFHDNIVEK